MLLLTLLTHLISDVDFGIGIIKFALNVLIDGFSILKKYVFLLMIIVKPMVMMVFVPHATMVMD